MYKQYVSALLEAMKNHNLPGPVKAILGLGLGYIISPIDILPDFMSFAGIIDDTVLAALLIGIGGKMVLDRHNKQTGNTSYTQNNPAGGSSQNQNTSARTSAESTANSEPHTAWDASGANASEQTASKTRDSAF